MGNLLTTYALLGYLKETSQSTASITELYTPLVKKALSDYSCEHGLSEYKGRSLSEIADKINNIFLLEIPIPILYKIMSSIRDEINDDGIFALYDDGAFIIKSFVFDDINNTIEQEQNNIQILKDDYNAYCLEYGFDCDFEELKSFILSSQIDLFTNYEEVNKQREKEKAEREIQKAMINIKSKYGKNAIIKGMNLQKEGTTIERNSQIGGHKE